MQNFDGGNIDGFDIQLAICHFPFQYFLTAYHMRIKFCGLNFRVFGWQENLCGVNVCGHGSVVGTIIRY